MRKVLLITLYLIAGFTIWALGISQDPPPPDRGKADGSTFGGSLEWSMEQKLLESHGLLEGILTAELDIWNRETMDLEASAHEVSAVAPLGDLPLMVLTAGEQARPEAVPGLAAEAMEELLAIMEAAWPELQLDLAAQSTRGEQRTIDGAGHFIHVDNPAAVSDAIKRLLSAT